jgi:hypothetical protein
MYDWLEADKTLDKQDKGVQNLMRAVQNRARHVRKHEKNPDYEVMRHLYKVLVEGGHKLKINPKHLSYNSLHYDLKKKVGDPIYAAFKASQAGKVMRGFFKQPCVIRAGP